VSTDTLERRFAAEIAKGRAALRMKLRRLQLRSAERGSVLMQMYLGKVILGQRENGWNGEVPKINIIIGDADAEEERLLAEQARARASALGGKVYEAGDGQELVSNKSKVGLI
jgi:hypothetical protein